MVSLCKRILKSFGTLISIRNREESIISDWLLVTGYCITGGKEGVAIYALPSGVPKHGP